MAEALEWIKESFSDAIEDLEDDQDGNDADGVPIVPILDCAVAAMDDDGFLKLLRAFGAQEPFDEQVIIFFQSFNLFIFSCFC